MRSSAVFSGVDAQQQRVLVVSAEYLRAAITEPGAPSGCKPVSTTPILLQRETAKGSRCVRVVLLSFLDLEGSFTLCLTMRDLIVDCENFLQQSLLELWYIICFVKLVWYGVKN